MSLVEKRRDKALTEVLCQLRVTDWAKTRLGHEEDIAWLRGEIRRLGRKAKVSVRTGTADSDPSVVWVLVPWEGDEAFDSRRAEALAAAR